MKITILGMLFCLLMTMSGMASAQYYSDGTMIDLDGLVTVDESIFLDEYTDAAVACGVDRNFDGIEEKECVTVEETIDPWGDIDYLITEETVDGVETAEVESWNDVQAYLPGEEVIYYDFPMVSDEQITLGDLDLRTIENVQVYDPILFPGYENPMAVALTTNGEEFPVVVETVDYRPSEFAGLKVVSDFPGSQESVVIMALNQ